MLERLIGPECPRCGCCDSRIVSSGTWWGSERQRRQCKNCGKLFGAQPVATPSENAGSQQALTPIAQAGPVTYVVMRCPHCDSTDTCITSTRKPVRHHKCRGCGETFKSVEPGPGIHTGATERRR